MITVSRNRIRRPAKRVTVSAGRSRHEARFALLWAAIYPGTELIREHRFAQDRRWRFDFACPHTKIAVEIDGGIYNRGRHNRAAGYSADCEKINRAQADGWLVFRLTPDMITPNNLLDIHSSMLRRTYTEPPTQRAD